MSADSLMAAINPLRPHSDVKFMAYSHVQQTTHLFPSSNSRAALAPADQFDPGGHCDSPVCVDPIQPDQPHGCGSF